MEVLEAVNTEDSHTVVLGHFRNLYSKAAVMIPVTVNPSYYGTEFWHPNWNVDRRC